MAKQAKSIKDGVRSLEQTDGRAQADTIRLWESYRDQAYLWRAIALLEMPAMVLALSVALIMYFTADTIIEVPLQPQPGHYSVEKLPDSEFVNAALEVVNLISTYQPENAREQFNTARKMLWEPALSEFEIGMMGTELQAIEETRRLQLFWPDEDLIQVRRFVDENYVEVRIPGRRLKWIKKEGLPEEEVAYYVTMTTIPRHVHNPFGIVVYYLSWAKITSSDFKRDSDEPIKAKR